MHYYFKHVYFCSNLSNEELNVEFTRYCAHFAAAQRHNTNNLFSNIIMDQQLCRWRLSFFLWFDYAKIGSIIPCFLWESPRITSQVASLSGFFSLKMVRTAAYNVLHNAFNRIIEYYENIRRNVFSSF